MSESVHDQINWKHLYDALSDRYLTVESDLNECRRNIERDVASAVSEARKSVMLSALSAADTVARLASSVNHDADKTPLEEAILFLQREYDQFLAANNVQALDAAPGTKFDPAVHEAVSMTPATGAIGEGCIVQEGRKGFRLGKYLLRPARVVVAGPPK